MAATVLADTQIAALPEDRVALLRRGQSERVIHEELDHFASFGFCRDLGLASEIGS
jgi:hypothetical protein